MSKFSPHPKTTPGLVKSRMTKEEVIQKLKVELLKETIALKNGPRFLQTTKKDYRTKSKYKNKSKVYNGRTYDSILEANHAEELDWRIKNGEIKEVIPQYKISLDVNGVHISNYYCDFKVIMNDGSIQFHEVKGMELPVWQLKKKLFLALKDQIEPGSELIVIK